jgi:hypothetical protein
MMGGMLLAILLYRPIYKQMWNHIGEKQNWNGRKTTVLAELKEKKQTMDSIYTTNKGIQMEQL